MRENMKGKVLGLEVQTDKNLEFDENLQIVLVNLIKF